MKIYFDTLDKFIDELKNSEKYHVFKSKCLSQKKKLEDKTWNEIKRYKGKFTDDIFISIIDEYDYNVYPPARWYGAMFATPNISLIFPPDLDEEEKKKNIEHFNKWMSSLLYSGHPPYEALDICSEKTMKLNGVKGGLPSLLFYLREPEKYNVWVPRTNDGIKKILSFYEEKNKPEYDKPVYSGRGKNYEKFNSAVNWFKDKYGFKPQEMDWILTFVSQKLEKDEKGWYVDDSAFDTSHPYIAK